MRAIADTHALIWYISASPQMPPSARRVFDEAAASGEHIAVSTNSLIEIAYLIDKRRVDPTTFDRVTSLLDSDGLLVEVEVNRSVATALRQVDRAEVPDLPDRILAATALHLGVPLISRDRKIKASSVTSIW